MKTFALPNSKMSASNSCISEFLRYVINNRTITTRSTYLQQLLSAFLNVDFSFPFQYSVQLVTWKLRCNNWRNFWYMKVKGLSGTCRGVALHKVTLYFLQKLIERQRVSITGQLQRFRIIWNLMENNWNIMFNDNNCTNLYSVAYMYKYMYLKKRLT